MKLISQTVTHKTTISCKGSSVRITTETANGKIISPLRLDVLYDFVKAHLSTKSRSPGIKRRALTIQKGELAIFQERHSQLP